MPRGLRVQLDPTPRPGSVPELQRNPVRGLRVALERRGAGSTMAVRDEPKPAKLVFHFRGIEHPRKPGDAALKRLGELSGELVLDASRQPSFANGLGANGPNTIVYDDPELQKGQPEPEAAEPPAEDTEPEEVPPKEEPPGALPRSLELEFDGAQFRHMRDPRGLNERLLLPAEVNDFPFVEIVVDLELGGSPEASKDSNDVLDVALTADFPATAPRYAVRFVDEVGEPIADVQLVLRHGKRRTKLTTAADGRAGMLATSKEPARASLMNAADIQKALKGRWDAPREKPLLRTGPDVLVLTADALVDQEISLKPGGPLLVCIRPKVVRARIRGSFFDKNKSFIPFSAFAALERLSSAIEENTEAELLVVGHTDSSGEAAVNDPLSLERAETTEALLRRKADVWKGRYGTSTPESRRWGAAEDRQMIEAMPNFSERSADEEIVRWYQRTRNLKVDGVAGSETRSRLVDEYMERLQVTLPEAMKATPHGCGENFPVDDGGQELDATPADGKDDPGDRRIEFFFFAKDFGVQPKVPGKNSKKDSKEYPEWRRRSEGIFELSLVTRRVRLWVLDEMRKRMKNVRYELKVGSAIRHGFTDDTGLLQEFGVPAEDTGELRWLLEESFLQPDPDRSPAELAAKQEPHFRHYCELDFTFASKVTNDARIRLEARVRLDNLGYSTGALQHDYEDYRSAYGHSPVDQRLDRPGFDELDRVHRDGVEAPDPEPVVFGEDPDPELYEDDGDGLFPLEIVLKDESGEPVPNEVFHVLDAEGVAYAGTLDANGRAVVDKLTTGAYTVVFPDVDGGALTKEEG